MISDPTRVEMAILRTARVLRRAFNTALAEFNLTMTEASLLAFVDEHGALSQRQLADLLQISRPSTGSVIDALERRGLIRRAADPDDRRVWLIELTSAAEESVRAFEAVDERLRDTFRRNLTRQQRKDLASLLGVVERNAESLAEQSGRPPE